MAILPLARMEANSVMTVFLISPSRVAMTRKCALVEAAPRGEHAQDLFALLEAEEVHQRPPLGRGAGLGDLVDLQGVDLPLVGEVEEGLVVRGDEEALHEVVVARAHARLALAARGAGSGTR